jgi:hypothetical protein
MLDCVEALRNMGMRECGGRWNDVDSKNDVGKGLDFGKVWR